MNWPESQASGLRLELRHFGRMEMGPGYTFSGHSHPGYEMILGLTGVMALQVGTQIYYLGQNDFLVFKASLYHFYWQARGPVSYFNATFVGESALLEETSREVAVRRVPEAWVEPLFQNENYQAETVLTASLKLAMGVEADRKNTAQPSVGRRTVGDLTAPTLETHLRLRIAELLQKEPGRAHSLGDLCQYFQAGKSRLSEKVKAATGHSLMDLYLRLKVDMALPLLREGMAIGEVSNRLGFANPYHFSRKVKAVTGVAPSFLKKNNK